MACMGKMHPAVEQNPSSYPTLTVRGPLNLLDLILSWLYSYISFSDNDFFLRIMNVSDFDNV